jgi:aarF domain-containing kinase
LAEETRKNLPVELDFVNEGKNAEKVAGYLKKFPFVKIPKIYWQYTSDRVLTMEYCEGGRIDDVNEMKKNKIDVNLVINETKLIISFSNFYITKISQRLGVLFSEMIFTHGFVHCDPHPGNLLINPKLNKQVGKNTNDFEIVLIDHGLYQVSLDLSQVFF